MSRNSKSAFRKETKRLRAISHLLRLREDYFEAEFAKDKDEEKFRRNMESVINAYTQLGNAAAASLMRVKATAKDKLH